MSGYIGVDNTARKVKELYVGVGNTARVVQKAYIGVGNVARLWYTRGTQLGSLAVGSSVYFKVNNVRTEWLVVQQGNPSTSIYDSSCDGTWLLMKNIYETDRWNNSNSNAYASSTMHTYLNGTFRDLLEVGVQGLLKQVKIPYRPGTGISKTVYSGAKGLSTSVFLLSAAEVGLNMSKMPTGEGTKLSYFWGCGSTGADPKRVAEFLNGTANSWWLRSPNCYDGFYLVAITADGGSSSLSRAYYSGIRPCIVLPKGTLLDDNNNVIGG